MIEISLRGIRLSVEAALIDGEVDDAKIEHVVRDGVHRLSVRSHDARPLSSIGLRFTVESAAQYLRNGYHSWDGSWFADVGTRDAAEPEGKHPSIGFAFTALLPQSGEGAVVAGFERHDRFQTRFRFGGTADRMTIDAETLLDRTGAHEGETLILFEATDKDQGLRDLLGMLAEASPLPPRIPDKRITGWCSWYNLYAAITEENILEHLAATRRFRDAHEVPLDVFLIDDGFTPEMGDWLDVKPQFPRGVKPLLSEIAAAGFTPGLWIAPFLVGNRSKLYAAHPDWVVGDQTTGGPLLAMHFYGEFRWHKRSEEYYVLDVTHPQAEAYIANVFRTWFNDWGARYFKTDFMYHGMDHGPDRAVWHQPGLSRVQIWRKMAGIIRSEIGNSLWLGCGAPLWASIGLVDANRIGRDVGVQWSGPDQSAESLLRDQGTRRLANGVLWQADPDCILLRDRFHDLSDDQVEALARLAGKVGGVLMASDNFDEMSDHRRQLFRSLVRAPSLRNEA
jgi:alpha-galactosidase